jgi:3-(methylthio)propionyl---CoA ligase
MKLPLIISSLIEHADRYHADTEIVSRTIEGPIHRYSYADAHRRARQLAKALRRLGVEDGDRVGTIAWNGYRHLELYYAISGVGAITHTINPRLFLEQICWIVQDADDRVVFFDKTFAPMISQIASRCSRVKHWVGMTSRAEMPPSGGPDFICYEDLLAHESVDYEWPQLDEDSACALCYTSGTSGNPKGVLYSHRSTLLHALSTSLPDSLNLSAKDVVLPVVPMFHVNAWGLPYSAPLVGAKLVFPGQKLDGSSLCELFNAEAVTCTAGVPTVWQDLIGYLESSGTRLHTLRRIVVGGSACPPSLMRRFELECGIRLQHAWGMSELSPLGAINTLKQRHLTVGEEERFAIEIKQGRPPFGIDLKTVDDHGNELPRDGRSPGELLVRGHWVLDRYFGKCDSPLIEGWFPTGDVAHLDQDGFMQITDRSKDVIKSGGEWISSIELENIAMSHPAIAEAAVIGIPHHRWDERPLIVAVRRPAQDITRDELLAHYAGKVARFCIPDDVVFVDEIPHTATGKVSKLLLREQFRNFSF